MGRSARGHKGIRGSAALGTARVDPGAVPAERLEPGEMRRVPFAGDLLGAVRIRAAYAPIPKDAFDLAGERLRAEEQAAYFYLLRYSYGEGRNFCRLPMRTLRERLRLSERRLLRVLDGVVAGGFARPLHRDNRGTLWRVLLPREVNGRPLGDDVLAGRLCAAEDLSDPRAQGKSTPSSRPPVAPRMKRPEEAPASNLNPTSLACALVSARGEEGSEALERAAEEIRELLAEGHSHARIARAVEAFRHRVLPKKIAQES